jgi:hypothetical protein
MEDCQVIGCVHAFLCPMFIVYIEAKWNCLDKSAPDIDPRTMVARSTLRTPSVGLGDALAHYAMHRDKHPFHHYSAAV